jgi:hypothetical protein
VQSQAAPFRIILSLPASPRPPAVPLLRGRIFNVDYPEILDALPHPTVGLIVLR